MGRLQSTLAVMAAVTLDLNWWIARRNKLYALYTSGSLEVRFEGRLERFRSMEELSQAIAFCNQQIADLGGETSALPAGRVMSTRVDQNDYI